MDVANALETKGIKDFQIRKDKQKKSWQQFSQISKYENTSQIYKTNLHGLKEKSRLSLNIVKLFEEFPEESIKVKASPQEV